MLDYDEPNHLVHQYMELDLLMCGKLLQHDMGQASPEPQLIAAAIAAHYENNRRRRNIGFPKMAAKTYAGIIMIGTAPMLTRSQAINRGQSPPAATVVRKLFPPVHNMKDYLHDGMVALVHRQIALQCLGAFKK
ncbi:hypothetical protein K438DRAFT_1816697, partial [Mycena galopus ATCC 62051]